MTVSRWMIPILVIGFMIGGYALRHAFTNPTTDMVFASETVSGKVAHLTATVQGVKCKGTAGFFSKLYEEEPGIVSIRTFADEHKAVFRYDPSITTPERIQEVMEQKITFGDGSQRQIFTCLEMTLK